MAEQERKPRRAGKWLAMLAAVMVAALAVWLVARSGAFHRYVQRRVAQALQQVTGGNTEIGSLTWNLPKLQFTVRNLTIHGLEGPNEAPYLHADRLFMDVKVISLLEGQFGLQTLTVDHPVIHLVVYADGRTNQPPPQAQGGGGSAVEKLFTLQVNRAEVRDGVLLVNDRPLPLDFTARNVKASLNYAKNPGRYSGSIELEAIETKYGALQPFASSAAAQIELYPNEARLTSFDWSAGKSRLHASGTLSDFARPRAKAEFHGQLDMAQWAPILRVPQARRGTVEISGAGKYSGAEYAATGKLQARDLGWEDSTLRIAGVSGGAEFTVDQNNAALSHIFATLLGGTVSGDAVVRNWSRAEAARDTGQQGTIKLAAHGLSVGRMAAAISSPALPLERVRPAGTGSGTVQANWTGSPARAIADVHLEMAQPARAAEGELPVAGAIEARYSAADGSAQVRSAEINARTLRLSAAGAVGHHGEKLNFSVTAKNLEDVMPLLAVLHVMLPLPPEASAEQGSMSGTLAGTLRAPAIAGHVEARGLEVPLPSATPATARRVRFDRLAVDVRYSPSSLSLSQGTLARGKEQAAFEFSAGLTNGSLPDSSPIAGQFSSDDFQIEDLLAIAGLRYPISGTMAAAAQLNGTKALPGGSGWVRIADGSAWGEPIRQASANLAFAGHEVRASKVQITQNGAHITGDGAYNLQTTALQFNVQGSGFELAKLQRLQAKRVTTSGQLAFSAQGSGTRQRPAINANLEVRNWTINGERAGDLTLRAVTEGEVAHISGSTDLRGAPLTVAGTVRLREDFPAELRLHFARLDFDPLLTAFTKAQLTGHSAADGTITLSGPLRHPSQLAVEGNIASLSSNVENVHIENDGPVRFRLANRQLKLEQFRLTGTDTSLEASGTVTLGGGAALDLTAQGNMNLQLLQTFHRNLHSAGKAQFQLQVRGTTQRPVLLGEVTIVNGDLALINFPNGLSAINGTLTFNQDRIQVQKLSAQTGGGTVNFGGFVSYGNTLGFNLTAKGKEVRIRYPAGVSTVVNPDLQLTGTRQNMLLSGQLTVTRFSMGPQFDLATVLARAKTPSPAPDAKSPLNALHFDVHLVSTPELEVQLSAAKLSGNADVRIRGTADHPVLLGRLDITEGQVSFNGTTYRIERGDVTFTNPVRIEPVLDVEVTTRVRDYEIALGFHGPIDRLSTTYRSDPPLPTSDIIALLAFGRTRNETAIYTEANPTFTETASNAILGQALTSSGTNRVQKLFGVSRIKISPEEEGTTTNTNPNAQVTIEQQVSKNMTVTYITDLSRSQQQVIQMEYAINRFFSIIALRDQNGVLSFDFRYRQRKR